MCSTNNPINWYDIANQQLFTANEFSNTEYNRIIHTRKIIDCYIPPFYMMKSKYVRRNFPMKCSKNPGWFDKWGSTSIAKSNS